MCIRDRPTKRHIKNAGWRQCCCTPKRKLSGGFGMNHFKAAVFLCGYGGSREVMLCRFAGRLTYETIIRKPAIPTPSPIGQSVSERCLDRQKRPAGVPFGNACQMCIRDMPGLPANFIHPASCEFLLLYQNLCEKKRGCHKISAFATLRAGPVGRCV